MEDAKRVKEIESTTNHDVKAIEYFIKEQLEKSKFLPAPRAHALLPLTTYLLPVPVFNQIKEYVHFCCTSEDINNLAYSLMLTEAKDKVLIKTLDELQTSLVNVAETVSQLIHTAAHNLSFI